MRYISAFTIFALFLMGSGCEIIGSNSENGERPLDALPRQLTAGEESLIEGSNAFAFGFLREVAEVEDGPNVFISPLSASMALGMALNGAVGETQLEMKEALAFGGMSTEEINTSYRSLIDLLRGLDQNVDMRLANALWLRDDVEFHESFIATTREHFDATAEELDFADPASVNVINRWVDRSTNGRIDSIIDEIAQDVVLYLMNAIYFRGDWTVQFDPAVTQTAPFHLADGSQRDVQMMHASELPVSYAFTEDAAVVDLPYSRGAYSMTVVVPTGENTLDDLIASLDESQWNAWLGALNEGTIDVYLPRFRLEYEKVLNAPLKALGMRQAFDRGAADFSGLSPAGEDMYISEVKQKTFLEVQEQGTEAAAVTSIEVRIVMAPPAIRVDRPFLMVIRERLSGAILFMGGIGAPESPR